MIVAVFTMALYGIVLTAGGFIFNREMVDEHCPLALECNMPIGNPFDDGGGIRMAQAVGAAVEGMDRLEVGIPLTPPRSLVRGILVNGDGRRFMNEDTYAGRLGQEFLLRQGGQVYFVHDDNTFAVNIAGLPLVPGRYEWQVAVDDEPLDHVTFTVMAG